MELSGDITELNKLLFELLLVFMVENLNMSDSPPQFTVKASLCPDLAKNWYTVALPCCEMFDSIEMFEIERLLAES